MLARARTAGIGGIVIPGIDLLQNRGALALAEGVADLFVAVGVHPNSADSFDGATDRRNCGTWLPTTKLSPSAKLD